MKTVTDYLNEKDLLAQLAEEAFELAQAALKLVRAMDGKNPTPVTVQDARQNLIEEFADVQLCRDIILNNDEYLKIESVIDQKEDRWVKRLEEAERKATGSKMEQVEGAHKSITHKGQVIGARGLLFLHCKTCENDFGKYLREPQGSVACNCGGTIDLERVVRFEYTCPCCKKRTFGLTNSESPEISPRCKCGNVEILTWDKKSRMYR